MSKTIDQRVVEMRFDNTNFEKNVSKSMSTIGKLKKSLKFEDSTKGFENISKAAGQVDMGSLGNGVESVKFKFSALEVMAVTALSNITNKAIDAGAQLVKSLSIDQITAGFEKFGQKTTAVATLRAQGYNMDEVEEQLSRLNWFTDETSYNFTDMVSNIAKFTASGKGLKESVTAMEGIANWAALSGQNAQTASRAMYQVSQAMGAGVMRLEDYKSIQNASMDTAEFRQKCIDAAIALGTLRQEADGTYKSLVSPHGKDDWFTFEQFTTQLTAGGWLTSDVMMKVFNEYSGAVDKIYDYASSKGITASQAIDELGDSVDAFGLKAFKAAQEAKTWADVLDSVKDAVSTGWMNTFELIFGNYDEARILWTDLANSMYDVFAGGAETRNELLFGALKSGWDQFINEGIGNIDSFKYMLTSVANSNGVAVNDLIRDYGSLEASFSEGWLTADMLGESISKLAMRIGGLSDEELANSGYTAAQRDALLALNDAVKDGSVNLEEYAEKISRASGRDNLIEGFWNTWNAIFGDGEDYIGILGTIKEAFADIFPPMTSERLYAFTERFRDLTEHFKMSEETIEKVKNTFKGFFSVLDMGWQIVKSVAEIFGHLLSKLAPIGQTFLGLSSDLGEFLTSVDAALKSENGLPKVVTKAKEAIDKAADAVKTLKDRVIDLIKSGTGIDLSKFESLKDIIVSIKDKVVELVNSWTGIDLSRFKSIWDILGKAKEKIGEFSSSISLSFPWLESFKIKAADTFENIHDSASENLTGTGDILTGITETIGKVADKISAAWDKIKSILDKIVSGVKKFFSPLVDFIKRSFGELTILDLVDTGFFVMLYNVIKQLLDIFGDFSGVGKGVTKLLDSARKAITAWQQDIKSDILLKIAGAVGILAAALWVISTIDADRVLGSLGAVTALVAEVGALTKIASKMTNSSNSLQGLADGMQLNVIAKAMLVISGSVLILSAALKKCEGLDWENTLPAMTAMFVLLGEMVAAMGYFTTLVRKNPIDQVLGTSIDDVQDSTKGIRSMAWNMVIISGAMLVLGYAVSKLGKMDRGELIQGGIAVSALMLVTGGIVAGLKAIKSGNMLSVAGSLIAIAKAITMLYIPVRLFGTMDPEVLEQGGLAVGAGLLGLTIAIGALKAIPGDVGKVSGALLGMALALTLLIVPIKALGNMDMDDLNQGLLACAAGLAGMSIALGGLSVIDKLFGSGNLSGIGLAMIELAAALTLLIIPIKAFGEMDFGDLLTGIAGMAVALIALGGTATLIQPLIKPLDSLANVLFKIGIGILALSVLAFLADMIVEAAPRIAKACLVLIDELLAQIEEYVPSIIEHLAKIIQKIGEALSEYFGQITTSDWISAAIFAGIVAASGFLVKWFASLKKDVPNALIGALGVAAILVIVGGIIAAMTLLDLTSVLTVAGSLSAVLLSLSLVIVALGLMPLTAGLAAGLVLAEFVAVMAVVLAALGGLNQIPGFSWLIDEGIKVLGQIGEGIGTFVGSIIGATIERVTEGIAESGKNLSDFMTNLEPFIEGAQKIDQDVLDGIIKLTECILLISAAKIVDAIASWLTGDCSLTQFGEELSSFGPEFSKFAKSVDGINVDAVKASGEALKTIAEAASSIPNEGGLLALIVGDNTLDGFASSLGSFGSALITYAESVQGIGKYKKDVEDSAEAAMKIIEVAELVPNTGGWLGDIVGNNDLDKFGASFKPFGDALMIYGEAVSGISEYQSAIEASAKAATKIIEVAELVPNSGGWLGDIVGNNDLDSFGNKIAPFGRGLMRYATAVQGIGSYITDINQSFSVANSIVSLSTDAKDIKYGEHLGKFADNLIEFAADMNEFTAECAKMNSESLDQLRTALTSIRDIAINFSSINTSSVDKFVAAMDRIGSTSLDTFLKSFTNAKSSAASAVNTLMTDLTDAIGSWDTKLKNKFKSSGKAGLQGLTESRNSFRGEGASLMTEVGKGVESRSKAIEQKFMSAAASCVVKLRTYYAQFQSAGSYLALGFANGITTSTPKAVSAASNMAAKAAAATENKLEVASPSKVGYRIGNFFGIGFSNGIDANAECAARSGENLAESAQSNLSAAIAKILAILDGELDTTPTSRPVLDLSEIQNGAAAMSALMNSLSGTPVEGTVSVARRTANCMSRRPFAEENVVSENAGTHNESTTNNFYITGADPNTIADAIDRKLQFKAGRRKATWA